MPPSFLSLTSLTRPTTTACKLQEGQRPGMQLNTVECRRRPHNQESSCRGGEPCSSPTPWSLTWIPRPPFTPLLPLSTSLIHPADSSRDDPWQSHFCSDPALSSGFHNLELAPRALPNTPTPASQFSPSPSLLTAHCPATTTDPAIPELNTRPPACTWNSPASCFLYLTPPGYLL